MSGSPHQPSEELKALIEKKQRQCRQWHTGMFGYGELYDLISETELLERLAPAVSPGTK